MCAQAAAGTKPGAREAAHLSSGRRAWLTRGAAGDVKAAAKKQKGRAESYAINFRRGLMDSIARSEAQGLGSALASAFASGSFGRPSCARMNCSTSASISSPLTTQAFSVSTSPPGFNFAGARKTL